MPTEGLVIDATAEDAANVPLDLMAAPFTVVALRTPTPGLDPRWAQPADADGDQLVAARYLNREIVTTLEIVPAAGSAATAQAALRSLADKLAKVNRRGGTLRRTLPTGDAVTFDLLAADPIDPSWDASWDAARTLTIDVRFTAKPFWRGTEVAYRAHAEASLPVLVFTETAPSGDVPALGRLVLTESQGATQLWFVWGLQCEAYDPASSAALFYEAESLTPVGSAAVATITGASGGGSNVVTDALLATDWKPMLSTQAAVGGGHLTHVGEFRVFARLHRPSTNTGAVSVVLDWALGDFASVTRNAQVDYPANALENGFAIADLGVVSVPRPLVGAGRWEGRIVAKSSASGDSLSVDCLWLVPTDVSGEARGLGSLLSPTAYAAQDGFNQSSGALSGQSLAIGGRWSGAGDADDFAVDGFSHVINRAADSDTAGSGRYAIAGTTALADTIVQVDVLSYSSFSNWIGVFARYVDTSNWLMLAVSGGTTLVLRKRVAGTTTTLGSAAYSLPLGNNTVRLLVTAAGAFQGWIASAGTVFGEPLIAGTDAVLATGGTLASGQVGLYEEYTHVPARNEDIPSRGLDNFAAWAPVADAAVFARRSVMVRHDGVVREDAGGTLWGPVGRYEGDYLTVPCAGPENRTLRVIAKASRNLLGVGLDSAVDDLAGQLYVTPRGLIVP